jgi:hypothetical protein
MGARMTDLSIPFLWGQMASPIPQERESASRELGKLIYCDLPGQEKALLHWLQQQRSESRCAEALLPLVWARMIDPDARLPAFDSVSRSVRYPSVLTTKLLSWLYGRALSTPAPRDLKDSLDSNDRGRFDEIRRSVAGYLADPLLLNKWQSRFLEHYASEFAVVDHRLGRPSLGKLRFFQQGNEFIPNCQPLAVEALISGCQRAIGRYVGDGQDSDYYGWYTCPVAPAWWFAPSVEPPEPLRALLAERDLSGVLNELESLRESDTIPARLHVRVLNTPRRLIDLHVVAFYQRVVAEGIPAPSEVLSAFGQPQLFIDCKALDLPPSVNDLLAWRTRLAGWDIIPATLAVSALFPTIWHADVVMREAAVPMSLSRYSLDVLPERRGVRFVQDAESFGHCEHWSASAQLRRRFDVLAPIGVATLLRTEFVARTAREARSVLAMAVRLTVYDRSTDYAEYNASIQEAFLGTTSLLIP